MEKRIKPVNLFIRRKRFFTAVAAFIFSAVGVALAVVFALAVSKNPPADDIRIFLYVAIACVVFICLYLGVLNVRNLFFPYLLTTDEKGIYNYSGYFHYGFVPWSEIEEIAGYTTLLDLFDNDAPNIKLFIKDLKSYKKTISLYKKNLLFWGGGNVKIFTLCSQIKKNELLKLLDISLKYYNSPEDGSENGN